jgi:2-oxoglutarate dehydrogenase E2 component (dihydrolipoamide succinyltransferase)
VAPTNGATAPSTAPAAPPLVVTADDEVVDFSKARIATAEHMVRSLATSAHALVAVEVDYATIDPVRRAAKLSYLPFVARAVVDAIREFPHVNASVDGDRLVVHRRVHLGVAVDVAQEALMVPVVAGADELRLRALSDAVADLAERARRRRLGGDELTGGTFTLTNVGSYGTLVTAPIINQPQVAILSTDGVRMAPVAVPVGTDGERAWGIAVHPVGNLCLSFDHRAFDGAYAAAFLARVREILQTRDWSTEVEP